MSFNEELYLGFVILAFIGFGLLLGIVSTVEEHAARKRPDKHESLH